jgi:hypothetical protein
MQGMPTGGLALLTRAVDIAREHHLPYAMLRPLGNIASFNNSRDLAASEAAAREGLAISDEMGTRDRYGSIQANLDIGLWFSGGWDEVASRDVVSENSDISSTLLVRLLVGLVREARGVLDDLPSPELTDDQTDDPYIRAAAAVIAAVEASAQGRYAEAADQAALGVQNSMDASGIDDDFALYWPLAVECALAAGHVDRARELLSPVAEAPPGLVTPLVRAQFLRLRAMTAIAAGTPEHADEDLSDAVDELRAFGAPYFLARALLSLAELRAGTDVPVSPLLDEARGIFESLGARPWVEAVDKVAAGAPAR